MPEFERVLEEQIENCIVADPERYLGEQVMLAARQAVLEDQTRPDLIGVDPNGRLVIYELKAAQAEFDIIEQIEGYQEILDNLTTSELRRLIERRSGTGGVEQAPDFAAWYAGRFSNRSLDDLRPCRLVIVSIGAARRVLRSIKARRAKGVDIGFIDLSGVEIGISETSVAAHGTPIRIRKPKLSTTGPNVQQLAANCEYYECDALFPRVRDEIEDAVRELRRRTYPIGEWYYRPGQALIGVDVFRNGIGAIGILIFKAAITNGLRDRIDSLRADLVWQGDSYTTDKAIDTVLVIHSQEEWAAHRGAVLDIATQIRATI